MNEEITDAMFDEAIRAYKQEIAAAVATLEDKYQCRKLKFTLPFTGSIPNVAYGKIDGEYFRFKFRGDHASLTVGTYDETLHALERMPVRFGERSHGSLQAIRHVDPRKVLPNVISKQADWPSVTGDQYNSSLNGEEAVAVFSRLVETLQDYREETAS